MTAGWGTSSPYPSDTRTAGLSASRRLLRRIMDLAAAQIPPQQRLDRIVSLIAADIVAEVCSIYVRRAGNVLELFATQGLRSDAVHSTRMRIGEGLVGLIAQQAELINTGDAQSHPHFQYRPETGEETYRSFLGAPILHGGEVVGVVTVQNTTHRQYAEDEVEALEIIATLLGEMLASGGLADKQQYTDLTGMAPPPRRMVGQPLVNGVALGHVVLHQPPPQVTRLISDNPQLEIARLERAMQALRLDVDRLVAGADLGGGDHGDVLEAYRMLSHDRSWVRRLREAILTGLSAEAAVRRVQDETKVRLSHSSSSYLRERLLDLDDLANRLLGHLVGSPRRREHSDLPEKAILMARTLSPAELLDYNRENLRGVVLEEGSHTAHVTIIARALEIPMLGNVERVVSVVREGDLVALDAEHGQLFLRPNDDVYQAFERSVAQRNAARSRIFDLKDLPSRTLDGIDISLAANAAFLMDLTAVEESGADGIGLYRTELAFMARGAYPDAEAQCSIYSRVVEKLKGKPCAFRTIDVGSDKALPYWRFPKEENPAMGWRAMRLVLDQPSLLRHQLRALLQAHAGIEMKVMFPMVATIDEFDRATELLQIEIERQERLGEPGPTRIAVGTMFEVPSLYFALDSLLPRIDFLSVGSNDLSQFLFAADRENPRLQGRYDPLTKPMLGLLRHVVEQCRDHGVDLSVCGEMASRPVDAAALIALGVRQLSLTPTSMGAIKAMVRSLDTGRTSAFLLNLLQHRTGSIRSELGRFCHDRGVDLGSAQVSIDAY